MNRLQRISKRVTTLLRHAIWIRGRRLAILLTSHCSLFSTCAVEYLRALICTSRFLFALSRRSDGWILVSVLLRQCSVLRRRGHGDTISGCIAYASHPRSIASRSHSYSYFQALSCTGTRTRTRSFQAPGSFAGRLGGAHRCWQRRMALSTPGLVLSTTCFFV